MDPRFDDLDLRRRRAQLNLNQRQIGELVEELGALLAGATLRDVEPRPPKDAILAFLPGPAGPDAPILRVYLSCQGDTGRVHLQHGRIQRHSGPEGPFYQRLRAELSGARLRRIQQVRGDRIVLFEFQAASGRRALVLELTGRHSNLILLGKGDEVLDILVPAPKKKEHPRLRIGHAWEPPPGHPKDENLASIAVAYPEPEDPPESVQRGHAHHAPLSHRIECALAPRAEADTADILRRDLSRRLERRLNRTRRAQRGLARRAEAAEGAERIRQDGELLKACGAQVSRGAKSVELTDYFDPETPMRLITLDPKLSSGANADKLFARYKKLLRSTEGMEEEAKRHATKAAALEDLLERLQAGEENPSDIEGEARAGGLLEERQQADARKRKAPTPRLPYKTFTACRGSQVRVGRTARDNDQLTFRHANGNDLWLHTADAPGSHVVLRLAKGVEPDSEELLDAATLAVHFSPLREASRADVHIAHIKEVKKLRGAKPGLVTLSGGKTLHVRMQPERIQRLLAREGGPSPSTGR